MFSKKAGPNTWFDGSKITQVVFGTISSIEKQPYFMSLLQKIADKSGHSLQEGGFTLIYSSDTQGFRIHLPNSGDIIDVLESSLVSEDDEGDITGFTKVTNNIVSYLCLTFSSNNTLQITAQA